jgi:hypothetical protein
MMAAAASERAGLAVGLISEWIVRCTIMFYVLVLLRSRLVPCMLKKVRLFAQAAFT